MIHILHASVELHAETVQVAGQHTIRLAGEIDLGTVGALYEAVRTCLDAHPDRILITMAEVTFCDCVGVRALLQARLETLRNGAAFLLRGPLHPSVARVFEYTRASAPLGVQL
ncbi:STAS domain-containing protein [Streptomyces sp. NPDC005562]|uniref:STAS domain-containing protein n=1 Tax=Streptomyces sp. NPDC005562 TaxID=3154890 RepID=UPI0033A7F6DA